MKKIHFAVILFQLIGCNHALSAKAVHENKNKEIVQTIETDPMIFFDSSLNTIPRVNETQKPVEVTSTYILNVPLITQNPELKYGCEVTSLAMVLQFAGVNTTKMELYEKIRKDPDPLQQTRFGDIERWGNPTDGFVGDMTGKSRGYAVFDKPIEDLVNHYLPGRAVNLTNHSFDDVLNHVANGYPVVVWTTGDYRLPDRPESWLHGNDTINTPLDLHAVVLVGYDKESVYLNDPLSGKRQVPVNKPQFIESWHALKSRAVSYR
jgi:uncharacterized protein YvpB